VLLIHLMTRQERQTLEPETHDQDVAWLIAPDSFKGTYSASEVAHAIARGIAGGEDDREVTLDVCPVADGGEGTVEILLDALRGTTMRCPAHDPLGRPLTATLGVLEDGALAIVEAASASGLSLVAQDERDAELASTVGTGELIAAAVAAGAKHVVIAAGGSASTDGGAGAIAAIEQAGGLRRAKLTVLADVTTPFELAAEVFAPQKGADAAAVRRLTARLNEQALALPRDPRGVPMTGAAGGLAGGLWARYDAALVAGAAWILDAIDFDRRLHRAHALVTGEGRLDEQTLAGKVIGEIAARCARERVALHAIVGSSALDDEQCARLGLESVLEASDLPELEAAGRSLAASAGSRV
jgi:glycerate kinase